MNMYCSGGWSKDLSHELVFLGPLGDENDARRTDRICDACLTALGAPIDCKLCGAESETGLCKGCELSLMVDMGEPSYTLTVYRESKQQSVNIDGAGAHLRIMFARTQPDFRAFSLARIKSASQLEVA